MKKEIAKEILEMVAKLNTKILEAKKNGLITDISVSKLEPNTGIQIKILEEFILQ